MRMIVVGLGNQGRKRLATATADVVATVDPVAAGADYRSVEQLPLTNFDGAFVCTPDPDKFAVLRYLLSHGKHLLVEKPLLPDSAGDLEQLEALARASGAVCYTAYNHRFEPGICRLRELTAAQTLGPIYLAKFLYANGTAADVRASLWRDQGLGVLTDLGSHLLDLTAWLLGRPTGPFRLYSASCFENRAYDHVAFGCAGKPVVALEASLISWRNTFQIDLYGALGSAHLNGLCKWGPSTLCVRRRIMPSGKPTEESFGVERPDPTWTAEYQHFSQLCRTGRSDFANDTWIASVLAHLRTEGGSKRWAA